MGTPYLKGPYLYLDGAQWSILISVNCVTTSAFRISFIFRRVPVRHPDISELGNHDGFSDNIRTDPDLLPVDAETKIVKFQSQCEIFIYKKCIWSCRRRNKDHFRRPQHVKLSKNSNNKVRLIEIGRYWKYFSYQLCMKYRPLHLTCRPIWRGKEVSSDNCGKYTTVTTRTPVPVLLRFMWWPCQLNQG